MNGGPVNGGAVHDSLVYNGAPGWAQALCGPTLPREYCDLAAQPSSPLRSWCVAAVATELPGPPQSGVT
ncbi:MAG: hypothetical protein ACRDZS_06155 [Acidimicrobiales bacterium]